DQTDNPHCPCYPDFPQLGADRYGVYLSGALYGSRSFQPGQDSLVGAGIFVMPKDVLTAPHAPGTSIDPTVKEFIVKGESYIMPAYAAPGGGPQESRGRGTEYLVSSDPGDCSVRCDRLHLFALSGTSTLRSGLVRLRLDERDVAVEPYALPIAAPQRDGSRPYAASLVAPGAPLPPVPRLDAVDSGINASMLFAGGVLWPTLSTSVAGPHGIAKDGIAYFGLAPRLAADGRLISVRVERQGYVVAPDDTFLLFPSVAADALGRGAIGFTVAGAARHPSAGFAPLRRGSVGPIVVAAAGALPADSYTGYDANDPQAQGTEAWGDYSAATFDEAGTVWLGAEYVPDTRVSPRTSEANWGTWLTRYKPW
ncbi:MAG: hypothetical protein ACJ8H8_20625, partial [Geminicoccaceae bacterium]